MDPSIELIDALQTGREDICASLVHLSFDILVTQEDTYVRLGLLFENTTGRALGNAVFSVRLPDGANVSLVECEVERSGGMILGAPEKRLEGRYCLNKLTDEPFFRCNIGRIEVERDVVIFMKYNFRPTREGNVIHMSLPLPGRQQLAENAIRLKTGINLESRYPVKVMQVYSSSHKIRSRFIAGKARIDVTDSLGQGDLDLAIMSLDTSRYLPPLTASQSTFSEMKNQRQSAPLPRISADAEYAPMAIFEEYCKAGDFTRIRECKRFSKYTMRSFSPTCNSSVSALSFFLSDSDTCTEYDLYENDGESVEEDTEDDVPNEDDGLKWLDFGDYSPRTPQDLSFESEGHWLSGSHPMRPSTSWLEEDMTSAADDEHEGYHSSAAKAGQGMYDLMDTNRGYHGAAMATASIIISKDKPKLIEIPARPRTRSRGTSGDSTPSSGCPPANPATPPPTPKSGTTLHLFEILTLADKLNGLGHYQERHARPSSPSALATESLRVATGILSSTSLPSSPVDQVHAISTPPYTSPGAHNGVNYGWV